MTTRFQLLRNSTRSVMLTSSCFDAGVFLIVGNCAQLGPVLANLGLADQIHHAIVNSSCFSIFQHFRLTGQMRCQDPELREAVHAIGYGKVPAIDGVPYEERPAARIHMPLHLFPASTANDDNISAPSPMGARRRHGPHRQRTAARRHCVLARQPRARTQSCHA